MISWRVDSLPRSGPENQTRIVWGYSSSKGVGRASRRFDILPLDVFKAPYRLGGEKSLVKPTNLYLQILSLYSRLLKITSSLRV